MAVSKTEITKAGRTLLGYFTGDQEATDEDVGAWIAVQQWRKTHSYPLALVTPGVRNWAKQITGGEIIIAQRLKRMSQIVNKLGRFPSMRLPQMEDIGGCRAVLVESREIDEVAARMEANWDIADVNDYRKHGKPMTGYRALHYVVRRRDRLIEVQLRTTGQHRWAEVIESTSSRLHFRLKDGEGPADLLGYFRVASEIIWRREEGLAIEVDLLDELDSLREDVRDYFVVS